MNTYTQIIKKIQEFAEKFNVLSYSTLPVEDVHAVGIKLTHTHNDVVCVEKITELLEDFHMHFTNDDRFYTIYFSRDQETWDNFTRAIHDDVVEIQARIAAAQARLVIAKDIQEKQVIIKKIKDLQEKYDERYLFLMKVL